MLIENLQEESLPWYEICLILFMFLALTISAMVNIYWMWLIVAQLKRIMSRAGQEDEGDVSESAQSEAGGS